MEPMFYYQFRLILIGDSTVGKSSLLKYFTEGKCNDFCDPTVGVDFYARLIEVRPGLRVKLQLWDTAGQEKFRSITKSYYRNSVGVLLLYDITNRKTFENIASWIHEAKINIGDQPCVYQLVGHKCDAAPSDRQVLFEEGEYFAKHHAMKFTETSAVTGLNVEEAFHMIARDIHSKLETGEFAIADNWDGIKTGQPTRRPSSISLSDAIDADRDQCYC